MISQLLDALQTVCITMLFGLLLGVVSMISRWSRGEDF
jgi:hypothetical protein